MSRKARPVSELIAEGMARAIEFGECLEWQGVFSCKGRTPVVKSRDGKTYAAAWPVNRFLWEQEHGPIPEGRLVYRKCCNNACVNIEHLACGTKAQWHAWRKKRGVTKHSLKTKMAIAAASRVRRNVVNTIEKARQVRALLGELPQAEIAKVVGINSAVVSDIARGRSWRDYSNPFAGLGA